MVSGAMQAANHIKSLQARGIKPVAFWTRDWLYSWGTASGLVSISFQSACNF